LPPVVQRANGHFERVGHLVWREKFVLVHGFIWGLSPFC
jgi:hypothetical protein